MVWTKFEKCNKFKFRRKSRKVMRSKYRKKNSKKLKPSVNLKALKVCGGRFSWIDKDVEIEEMERDAIFTAGKKLTATLRKQGVDVKNLQKTIRRNHRSRSQSQHMFRRLSFCRNLYRQQQLSNYAGAQSGSNTNRRRSRRAKPPIGPPSFMNDTESFKRKCCQPPADVHPLVKSILYGNNGGGGRGQIVAAGGGVRFKETNCGEDDVKEFKSQGAGPPGVENKCTSFNIAPPKQPLMFYATKRCGLGEKATSPARKKPAAAPLLPGEEEAYQNECLEAEEMSRCQASSTKSCYRKTLPEIEKLLQERDWLLALKKEREEAAAKALPKLNPQEFAEFIKNVSTDSLDIMPKFYSPTDSLRSSRQISTLYAPSRPPSFRVPTPPRAAKARTPRICRPAPVDKPVPLAKPIPMAKPAPVAKPAPEAKPIPLSKVAPICNPPAILESDSSMSFYSTPPIEPTTPKTALVSKAESDSINSSYTDAPPPAPPLRVAQLFQTPAKIPGKKTEVVPEDISLYRPPSPPTRNSTSVPESKVKPAEVPTQEEPEPVKDHEGHNNHNNEASEGHGQGHTHRFDSIVKIKHGQAVVVSRQKKVHRRRSRTSRARMTEAFYHSDRRRREKEKTILVEAPTKATAKVTSKVASKVMDVEERKSSFLRVCLSQSDLPTAAAPEEIPIVSAASASSVQGLSGNVGVVKPRFSFLWPHEEDHHILGTTPCPKEIIVPGRMRPPMPPQEPGRLSRGHGRIEYQVYNCCCQGNESQYNSCVDPCCLPCGCYRPRDYIAYVKMFTKPLPDPPPRPPEVPFKPIYPKKPSKPTRPLRPHVVHPENPFRPSRPRRTPPPPPSTGPFGGPGTSGVPPGSSPFGVPTPSPFGGGGNPYSPFNSFSNTPSNHQTGCCYCPCCCCCPGGSMSGMWGQQQQPQGGNSCYQNCCNYLQNPDFRCQNPPCLGDGFMPQQNPPRPPPALPEREKPPKLPPRKVVDPPKPPGFPPPATPGGYPTNCCPPMCFIPICCCAPPQQQSFHGGAAAQKTEGTSTNFSNANFGRSRSQSQSKSRKKRKRKAKNRTFP